MATLWKDLHISICTSNALLLILVLLL